MGLTFDSTIHLSDLAMMAGAIWGFWMVFMRQRDFNRDILTIIGKGRPPGDRFGVLGDIENLKEKHDADHEKLNGIASALGFNRRGVDPIQPTIRTP